ncbi:hypothetical protein, partial [Rubrobacter xylanophilus]|uniref:hypothetical protein n=1 Tax=Rubrobacter xylanophilus TaxID=49319 RepID=UPI001C640418
VQLHVVLELMLRGQVSPFSLETHKLPDTIEAYPFDTAGLSSTHRGHSSLFKKAGFRQDGKRWFLETFNFVSLPEKKNGSKT